jgi:hypothetical protein
MLSGVSPVLQGTVILVAAMSDESKKHPSGLEKLAEEIEESVFEAPKMEPGEADTTPAVPTKDDSK